MAKTSSREDLLMQIEEQIRNVRKYILSGDCEDFTSYRYTVGKLEGMTDVRDQFIEFFADEENDG